MQSYGTPPRAICGGFESFWLLINVSNGPCHHGDICGVHDVVMVTDLNRTICSVFRRPNTQETYVLPVARV